MALIHGIQKWATAALVWFAIVGGAASGVAACPQTKPTPQLSAPEDLERLRAMLSQPGPEGREARETAVERLLTLPTPAAHRLLQERLLLMDVDDVCLTIVTALQGHVLLPSSTQFGGAIGAVREQIMAGYVSRAAKLWRDQRGAIDDVAGDPRRRGMRTALQRLPPRDLDAAARYVLQNAVGEEQIDVMRCLADMQHTLFAATLAEYLEMPDAAVRAGAMHALQLLTCYEQPIETKAQFAAWSQTYGALRYIDLLERAARLGSQPLELLKKELTRVRIEAACEVVRAHVARSPGIDWAAVQARVVVADPHEMDACLAVLQTALPAVSGDDSSAARQAFCRALLQQYRLLSPEEAQRRAMLLEVAAYLGRAEDADLAAELVGLLLAQLDVADAPSQVAALRGLRRFPSVEARTRLVALARRLLREQPVAREPLTAILSTLTVRTAPRWLAPSPLDGDRSEWLDLLRAFCRSDEALALREQSLMLAQTLDARDQLVAEVFDLLLELVRDSTLSIKFRATCAIHLQGWRAYGPLADAWLRAQHELLRDSAPELRQRAAESLATITDSVDSDRVKWIKSTIVVLRERLLAEPDPGVFRSLVECLQACGREALMPESAIGALRWVLVEIGNPVLPEHQFRFDPLLQALATIGADARADRGQWLAACGPLVTAKRRQSLRLILQSHAAVDFAKDVLSTEPGLGDRARQAMHVLIETAVCKPARESWASSEELQREARDVRTAFGALDALDDALRLDTPNRRLLRLEVDLVGGKAQDVVQRATTWLVAPSPSTGANGPARVVMAVEDLDRMRLLVAEAHLQLERPAEARRLLQERSKDAVADAAVNDLEVRIAKALAPTDLTGAVELFERALRRTATDDAAFRGRFLEWMQAKLRVDPSLREQTLLEATRHAALFASPECPAELREQFEQLRASR